MEAINYSNIGKNMKKIRNTIGMTQRQLSAVTGLSVGYISLIERNKVEAELPDFINIAKALGVSLDTLIEAPALSTSLRCDIAEILEHCTKQELDEFECAVTALLELIQQLKQNNE